MKKLFTYASREDGMVEAVLVVLLHGIVEDAEHGHEDARLSRGNLGQHGQHTVEEDPLVKHLQQLAYADEAIDPNLGAGGVEHEYSI